VKDGFIVGPVGFRFQRDARGRVSGIVVGTENGFGGFGTVG
jgi:hypothetical protein